MKYVILVLSVMLTVFAQTLWKIGGSSLGEPKPGIVNLILAYATSPTIVAGFGLATVASLLWTYALSKLDFSFVSFVGSLSYVLILFVSLFVFKETISPVRWAGCALIFAGVLLVLRS